MEGPAKETMLARMDGLTHLLFNRCEAATRMARSSTRESPCIPFSSHERPAGGANRADRGCRFDRHWRRRSPCTTPLRFCSLVTTVDREDRTTRLDPYEVHSSINSSVNSSVNRKGCTTVSVATRRRRRRASTRDGRAEVLPMGFGAVSTSQPRREGPRMSRRGPSVPGHERCGAQLHPRTRRGWWWCTRCSRRRSYVPEDLRVPG